ncbi:MAG: hypothetical protein WKF66_13620 [Pedobacter sp.]
MKFNYLLLFFFLTFTACDPGGRHYILINETGHNITTYQPRNLPLTNDVLYQAFKPRGSDSTQIRFDFFVKAFSTRENFSMGSFGSQFTTSDGKLHLFILDMDTLKSLAKNHALDSMSIKQAILKHAVYSQEELESTERKIKYSN